MKVEVFSKTICPYCTQAKNYLKKNGIEYTETNLDDDEARKAFYEMCGPGVRTVPQIFVDGERIGGYTELIKSDVVARHQAGNFNADEADF
jgi:glutaredoxin 3